MTECPHGPGFVCERCAPRREEPSQQIERYIREHERAVGTIALDLLSGGWLQVDAEPIPWHLLERLRNEAVVIRGLEYELQAERIRRRSAGIGPPM